MRYEGTVTISVPREKVWEFMTDAEFVSRCAPGLKEWKIVIPDKQYLVVAAVGFGSVMVVFKTDVEFQVMKEIESARVKAHGRSADSVVDATSEIFLSNGIDGTTDLRWTAEIAVFGKISSVASRMMGSVTRKLATEFFDCVKKQIEA